MKKAHRELQAYIRNLPPQQYRECLATIHRPTVTLAERILFFEEPFEALRLEQAGFDPLVRFLIDRAEAGDALAIKARAEMVCRTRALRLSEPWPEPPTDYWGEFFAANKAAWDRFHRSASPWLFADPHVLHMDHFERDPAIDFELNHSVLTSLADFEFRRLARSFQTDTLGEPLIIKWDKGTWSMTLSLFLEMPHRCLSMPLGEPFSSGACFHFNVAADAGPNLRAFFRVLRTVFPDLLQAIREGMHAQDEWLQQSRGGAA